MGVARKKERELRSIGFDTKCTTPPKAGDAKSIMKLMNQVTTLFSKDHRPTRVDIVAITAQTNNYGKRFSGPPGLEDFLSYSESVAEDLFPCPVHEIAV